VSAIPENEAEQMTTAVLSGLINRAGLNPNFLRSPGNILTSRQRTRQLKQPADPIQHGLFKQFQIAISVSEPLSGPSDMVCQFLL